MSKPEPGRRHAGLIIGALTVLGVGGGVAIALRKKTTTGTPGAPAQVTGVKVTPTSSTAATVSWTAIGTSGVTYTVQHTDASGQVSDKPMGNASAIVTTSKTSLSLTGLTPGQPLHLTIQACTGGTGMAQVCGNPSAVASVTMPSPTPTMAQVTGVTVTATSPTTATVSWNAVTPPSGVTGVSYTVTHTNANGNASGTPMGNSPATVTTSSTSISLTGLTPGQSFHCDVTACGNY